MADSIRKQIIDEVQALLLTSTGITTVTDIANSPFTYPKHKYPVVTVTDRDTDIARLSFKCAGIDKEAIMDLQIRGFVQDDLNNTATKRTNLIRDIQQKMVASSTTLDALVFDIEDVLIETDDGLLDNYSIFDVIYNITYHYNHASP